MKTITQNVDAQPRKPQHFWRIHKRVCRRVFFDLPDSVKDVIAADSTHESAEYKWFDKKVADDTQRLYEDPQYYDNEAFTFRHDKEERVIPFPNTLTLALAA
jgi:hypothetical protein